MTGNAERFAELCEGHNDTRNKLQAAIKADVSEIFPLRLCALLPFLWTALTSTAPLNTFVPGVVEQALALQVRAEQVEV